MVDVTDFDVQRRDGDKLFEVVSDFEDALGASRLVKVRGEDVTEGVKNGLHVGLEGGLRLSTDVGWVVHGGTPVCLRKCVVTSTITVQIYGGFASYAN